MGIFAINAPDAGLSGSGSPTGYVSGGLIVSSMMSDKVNARHVDPYYFPPSAGINFQYMAACTTDNAPKPPWGPEIRCFNKPPQYYAGLGPLKIRYWGFFPDVSRSVFGFTPTPEVLSFVTMAWWVPDPWDTNTAYPAGGLSSSAATYTVTDKVKRHPLTALTPDPAVAWSDDAMLYLYINAGCPTTPNEFGLIACEVLYPL